MNKTKATSHCHTVKIIRLESDQQNMKTPNGECKWMGSVNYGAKN